MKTFTPAIYTLSTMLSLVAILTSCETTIDINSPDEQPQPVVHAVAQAGEKFSAVVATSYLYGQARLDLDQVQNIDAEGQQDFTSTILDESTVTLTNEQGTAITLNYDKPSMTFVSNYTPMAGETLKLNVTTPGGLKTESQVTVPLQVNFTIIEKHKQYSKTPIEYYDERPWYTQAYAEDSLLYITLRINDPANEHNFYRLKARSTYASTPETTSQGISIIHHDAFSSESPIFYDRNITKAYYWWPAHFSNVFDDTVLNEQQNTFTIALRPRKVDTNPYSPMHGLQPMVIIELQQVTPTLYYYLKAYQRSRIADSTTFDENAYFPSNISGGWGIMGGINSSKIVLK
ncbi:MAG: DUF4249 family protein [Muribaculaceae bacterium]